VLAEQTQAILTHRVIPLPPTGPIPDMLYLAVDGTGVPMTPAETAGRPGKHPDGRARTREAKLACLFTQTHTDEHDRPVRDADSTSYLTTLDPVEVFADLLEAEAHRRGAEHIRQLVILGDSARWIWNLADQRFPAATGIVDLFHAREHLHALAEQLAFIVPDPTTWLDRRLTDLDNGDIEALSRAARLYPLLGTKATDVDKAVTYFETNAHRMRYAHYRSLGMFVGSGVVEAGCKSVIGARLKQSGMHWTRAAPPESPPCAASTPAAAGTRSARNQTPRPPSPNHRSWNPAPATYKSDAHPCQSPCSGASTRAACAGAAPESAVRWREGSAHSDPGGVWRGAGTPSAPQADTRAARRTMARSSARSACSSAAWIPPSAERTRARS
jgi:hypothetical protein